jgi:FkbM family methyltransferase
MRNLAKYLAKSALRRCGIYSFGSGSLPKGVDLFRDLHRFHLAEQIGIVVDVGANIGSFTLAAHRALPDRRILAFEPASRTFAQLKKNIAPFQNILVYQTVLGSQSCSTSLKIEEDSVFNALIAKGQKVDPHAQTEIVSVKTLDAAMRESGLISIGLLKTDTEGFDAEVLKGARDLLSAGAIKAVFCEVTFHADDMRHTAFSEVWELLRNAHFDLFGFYNQSCFREQGALDYCDALFVNTSAPRAASLL